MTDTRPTPIADSITPPPPTGPVALPAADEPHEHADWTPDVAALQSAHGDTAIWAQQFAELVGHTTGKWIDAGTFEDWLRLFSSQVSQGTWRTAMFSVASTYIDGRTPGDASLALLQFRDTLAAGFRQAAGL